ncbi:hypothetical protein [Sphingobium sp. AP50]|uniref:hypothetical protein n=1 Tax=Sphingobium sp. AP50 TaxID=1884369 RepID=UPI000B886896|nr:hypothetical protein [Sphingobium sp. AP50]
MKQYFDIVAIADPQTLPRLLGWFAQRSLVPARVSSDLHAGDMHVRIEVDDLDPRTADQIAAKISQGVLTLGIVRQDHSDSCHEPSVAV